MTKLKKDQVQINVRLDRDLNDSFERVTSANGFSKSLVLREMIKRYIKNNGQMDLFDKRGEK